MSLKNLSRFFLKKLKDFGLKIGQFFCFESVNESIIFLSAR